MGDHPSQRLGLQYETDLITSSNNTENGLNVLRSSVDGRIPNDPEYIRVLSRPNGFHVVVNNEFQYGHWDTMEEAEAKIGTCWKD
ncbi:hypothetical protein DFA_01693 [Cavenderia fasciculata]|uniref:Uncharacterized protein n=1 Tax=Cavenderia fasciculata TaxID=261658 RepID=F4PU92_CACFS|nr:uncharacterized protein DFA_01693 [Cavenderia fasciculata]EGG21807.1 hypothetical protein DFA_01693 [Cavenderia fasciculata]|eukprot:XP_004359657.1 hypothetical protein DFA_01693 [Cavenderia fasciculata]